MMGINKTEQEHNQKTLNALSESTERIENSKKCLKKCDYVIYSKQEWDSRMFYLKIVHAIMILGAFAMGISYKLLGW